MVYVWLILFIVSVILFWGLNLIGLPGNWLIIASVALWVFIGPDQYQFHWGIVVALTLLAIIGELIEFLTSVLGTKQLGGSNRGATLSVIGSIVGGMVGAAVGIPFPIPLVGMLIGSILLAGVGAWVGATLGERWVGKPLNQSVKIGAVAFLGRLLGTAGKLVVGSTMVVLAIAAPFIPILAG
jgi:uncharacterized protein YqgC (DUF456 family)